jgi:hypothetical protein
MSTFISFPAIKLLNHGFLRLRLIEGPEDQPYAQAGPNPGETAADPDNRGQVGHKELQKTE